MCGTVLNHLLNWWYLLKLWGKHSFHKHGNNPRMNHLYPEIKEDQIITWMFFFLVNVSVRCQEETQKYYCQLTYITVEHVYYIRIHWLVSVTLWYKCYILETNTEWRFSLCLTPAMCHQAVSHNIVMLCLYPVSLAPKKLEII